MYSILAVLRATSTCSSWTIFSGSIHVLAFLVTFGPFSGFSFRFVTRKVQKWGVFCAIFCSYEKVVTVKVGLKTTLMRVLTGKVPYRVSIGQNWPSLARKNAFYPLLGVKMVPKVCMLRAPPPFRREVVDFGCASGCL